MERECRICGSNTDIELHHINGNQSDNRPENWAYLCTKHHRQLHNKTYVEGQLAELREELPERALSFKVKQDQPSSHYQP